MGALLEVKNLAVTFHTDLGDVEAVKEADFTVEQGEIYGIVGESGSGKSVTTKAIMRINPDSAEIMDGEVLFDGEEILSLSEKNFRGFRGKRIAMIFQDSLAALNPVYTVGSKMVELLCRQEHLTKKDAKERALKLLERVGISDPKRCFKSYPHELSGGMRQRIMIAMAISCNPELIIADEPTTALDVTIQAQILHLLKLIRETQNMSMILITHDLGVVAQMCRRVSVMCGGYVVETGTVRDIFHHPVHPYTRALIASMPRRGKKFEPFLEHGHTSSLGKEARCPFLDRCSAASERCRKGLPEVRQLSENHVVRCWEAWDE